MKTTTAVLAVLVASTMLVFGQGTVHFANTATTLITTNDYNGHIGVISGANTYRIALYAGPFGSAASAMTLINTTTNSGTIPLVGRFDGGNVSIPFSSGGSQVSFQVRAWFFGAGSSWEQASTNNGYLVGTSDVGYVTIPNSGSVELFGTAPGQVGGFVLTPVPEPSAVGIVAVYAGVLLCRRRMTRNRL